MDASLSLGRLISNLQCLHRNIARLFCQKELEKLGYMRKAKVF